MGHGFNAADYAACHEPWTFTDLNGKVWEGRDLSAPEVAIWIARFDRADSHAATEKLVRRLCMALFPWKPQYLWSGDPSARLFKLPAGARKAALDSFFRPRRLRPQPPAVSSMTTKPNSAPCSPTSEMLARG